MASEKVVLLSSGYHMPIVGLGTWQNDNEDLMESTILSAIDAGYRHIDTAYTYHNEHFIGNALSKLFKSGKITREELFIVTKLPMHGMKPDLVEEFFKKSLSDLQLDYVDMYLIHVPMATKDTEDEFTEATVENVDLVDTWRAMEALVNKGLVRSIGLSNCNSHQIQRIYDAANIKPANLQVECHAYLPQFQLHEFCKKLNIVVTGYSPLGSPAYPSFAREALGLDYFPDKLVDDEKVKPLAEKHKKTPAQILLKYLVQRGIVIIPKSSNPERLKENIAIFDFSLDEEDIKVLKSMENGLRFFTLGYYRSLRNHPEYPFHLPF